MTQPADALIATINKRLKSEVLMYASRLQTFQRITTGSLSFDLMLGGGWPLNCWNEIIGLESHGKTVMALKTLAANMEADPNYTALWIASEDFNEEWALTLGVDLNRVVLAVTNAMEDAYSIIIEGARQPGVRRRRPRQLPGAAATRGRVDGRVAGRHRGTADQQADACLTTGPASQARRAQLPRPDRQPVARPIGVTYGDPRTTPGGKGKNFSYFTRVEVVRDGWIDRNKVKVGQVIKARTMKNKTAPPARVAVTDFYFDNASPFHAGDYDTVAEVWNIATTYDIIERKGAWYHYGGQRWNGKEPVLQSLREDLDLRRDIDAQVRKFALNTAAPVAPASSSPSPGEEEVTRSLGSSRRRSWPQGDKARGSPALAPVGEGATTCAKDGTCCGRRSRREA